jgi:hypothetical protein
MSPFLHNAKQEALKSIQRDYPNTDANALSRAFEAGVHARDDVAKFQLKRDMDAEVERQNVVIPFGQTDAMIARIEAASKAAQGEGAFV